MVYMGDFKMNREEHLVYLWEKERQEVEYSDYETISDIYNDENVYYQEDLIESLNGNDNLIDFMCNIKNKDDYEMVLDMLIDRPYSRKEPTKDLFLPEVIGKPSVIRNDNDLNNLLKEYSEFKVEGLIDKEGAIYDGIIINGTIKILNVNTIIRILIDNILNSI